MAMDKPTTTYPKSPTSTPSPMPGMLPDPSILGQSFDQIIKNRGVRFIHRRCTPCPNMRSLDDNSHLPSCELCRGDGFWFYKEKEIYGVWHVSHSDNAVERQGIWEWGQAYIVFPTEYADGEEAEFNTYDQLVIPDFTTRIWELIEYHPTPSDTQYLRYPIQKIDYIGYATSNTAMKELVLDTDYEITADGGIKWLIDPPYNATNERGKVITITYFAYPVYTVLNSTHDMRMTQQMLPDGTKVARRLPQTVIVKKDFVANANFGKRT